MKSLHILLFVVIVAMVVPASAIIKSCDGTGFCVMNQTMNQTPGTNGTNGTDGTMNMTANMTAGPAGEPGAPGSPGAAASIAVNYTFTGTPPNVVNVGTASAALLDFTIPNGTGTSDHHLLTNLTDGDDHTQYALLAGRPTGQALNGGTNPGDDLVLNASANADVNSYIKILPSGGSVVIGDDTMAKPAILYIRNQSDYDAYIRLHAGDTANQRFYIAWQNNTGGDSFILGMNSEPAFVFYDSMSDVHRFKFKPNSTGGDTLMNSIFNGAVKVNYLTAEDPTSANLGTGGFEVWSGGASPSRVMDVAGSNGDITLAGASTIYGGNADNGDLNISGTVSSAKTTSYVKLQPDGGGVTVGYVPSPLASLHVNGSEFVTGILAAGTYNLKLLAADGADRDIFLAGASGVSNGFTVQRVSSVMKYVFNSPGNVIIGSTIDTSNAILNINSTSKYVLPPRMTGAQKEAITGVVEGATVYDTTNHTISVRNETAWQNLGTGSGTTDLTDYLKLSGRAPGQNVTGNVTVLDRLMVGDYTSTRKLALYTGSSSDTYASILAGSGKIAGILFGYPGTDYVGRILYNTSSDNMYFWLGNKQAFSIVSNGGHGGLGLGTTDPVNANLELQDRYPNSGSRMYIIPNGTPSGLKAGFKLFGTDFIADKNNYNDFGLWVDDYNYINSKQNGTGTAKDFVFTKNDTNFLMTVNSTNGNVLIGSSTKGENDAALQIDSTTKAFLPPRTVPGSISAPVEGMVIYDTNNKTLSVRNDSQWMPLGTGGGGAALTKSQVCEYMYPVDMTKGIATNVTNGSFETSVGCGIWQLIGNVTAS